MDLTKKNLDSITKWIAGNRKRTGLMAFQSVTQTEDGRFFENYGSANDACTGNIMRGVSWAKPEEGYHTFLGMSFNGEAPKDKGSGGAQGLSYENHHFKGGPISLAWLEFITDPNGYWRDVLPFIVNLDDLKEINDKTGIIFRDLHLLPAEATFNFMIATRWPQEQHRRAKVWYDLVQRGVDRRIAFVYANWYFTGGITSTPSHTIGFAPPKVWAKQFYKGVPYGSVRAGDKPTTDKPARIRVGPAPIGVYGLVGTLGENRWFNHDQLGNTNPMMNFFYKTGTGTHLTGESNLIPAITDFVNS